MTTPMLSEDIYNNPAKFEYFIRFNIIGMENNTFYYFNLKNRNGLLGYYCGKVYKEETLRDAIKRELYDNFGVEKIREEDYLNNLEYTKDHFGKIFPRVVVTIKIDKNQIKTDHFMSDVINWTEEEAFKFKENSEALEWLQKENTSLANNRFKNKEEAKLFVKKLYNLGAVRVELEYITEKDLGEECVDDYLYVKLPEDPKLREKLFAILVEETELGYDGEYIEKDEGQEYIDFLWK